MIPYFSSYKLTVPFFLGYLKHTTISCLGMQADVQEHDDSEGSVNSDCPAFCYWNTALTALL